MPEAGQTSQSQNAVRKLRVVMAQLDFLVGDIPGNTDLILEATQRAWAELQADIDALGAPEPHYYRVRAGNDGGGE